jgi:hypothetical protein
MFGSIVTPILVQLFASKSCSTVSSVSVNTPELIITAGALGALRKPSLLPLTASTVIRLSWNLSSTRNVVESGPIFSPILSLPANIKYFSARAIRVQLRLPSTITTPRGVGGASPLSPQPVRKTPIGKITAINAKQRSIFRFILQDLLITLL